MFFFGILMFWIAVIEAYTNSYGFCGNLVISFLYRPNEQKEIFNPKVFESGPKWITVCTRNFLSCLEDKVETVEIVQPKQIIQIPDNYKL